jgi:hypothetical protein
MAAVDVEDAWEACLELQEDPDDETSKVTLCARGPTEDAAKAAVAEALHERVFLKPISSNISENFNDYDSPLSFLDSIRREGEGDELPESYTAAGVWEALFEALRTLCVKLPPLQLRYFPLLAKGLGPALVLEHSGLTWVGNRDLPFSVATDWAELKPTTPFGQLPLLCVAGLPPIAQSCAIINYVGKVAGTEGGTPMRYAWSQMLLSEAEDIYMEMNKFLPTVYKRLSAEGVTTSKGDLNDYLAFWQTRLPAHLERLERLLAKRGAPECEPPRKKAKLVVSSDGGSGGSDGSGGGHEVSARRVQYLPGELQLFSMLYQACRLHDGHMTVTAILDALPGV